MTGIEQTHTHRAAIATPAFDADLRAFMLGVYAKVTAGLMLEDLSR